MPEARWHVHEPVGRERVHAGSSLAFGQAVDTIYSLDQAQVIVALGADFLGWGPAKIRLARDFASQREPKGETGSGDDEPPVRGRKHPVDHRRELRPSGSSHAPRTGDDGPLDRQRPGCRGRSDRPNARRT